VRNHTTATLNHRDAVTKSGKKGLNPDYASEKSVRISFLEKPD
jgi:hypothetical protein